MDKTLFANLKLSDGREAQARELLDDKIHRLGGAAPYLSAANDDLIQEVAADLAEAKRLEPKPATPTLDDDDAGELAFDGGVPVDPRLRIPGEERKLEALMAKIDLTKPPAAAAAAGEAAAAGASRPSGRRARA
ncbi:RNA cap guanine-N2 methyltransferase [Aureococcus anophagefferens]|nr:RNA cap guanine-N2 methyltransferase [Aureococcus anophagefferens]